MNLWRTWGGPLATAFGALAVASWLRFGWIENGGLAALCSAQNECLIKTAVVASFTDQRVGWAALLIALVALATRRGALAYVTLALACAGLMLYGAGPAAPALWIAVLLLVGAWPKALR
ncbi:MAG: hypothetical protein JNM79_02280 [Burkholderiales bacterium]|nr:hypothetical protein [Burkholderiales bacterium]